MIKRFRIYLLRKMARKVAVLAFNDLHKSYCADCIKFAARREYENHILKGRELRYMDAVFLQEMNRYIDKLSADRGYNFEHGED